MTTFAALVDKLIEASSYANLVHVIAPNDEGGPRELAAARQAIFTAFDVAVRTADADGYARAMGEVDEACVSLYDYDGGGRRVMIGKTSFDPPWRWRVWPEAKPATPAALTPAAAILAAAAAIATDAPTDPPALVNGGPARDALDDGR